MQFNHHDHMPTEILHTIIKSLFLKEEKLSLAVLKLLDMFVEKSTPFI